MEISEKYKRKCLLKGGFCFVFFFHFYGTGCLQLFCIVHSCCTEYLQIFPFQRLKKTQIQNKTDNSKSMPFCILCALFSLTINPIIVMQNKCDLVSVHFQINVSANFTFFRNLNVKYCCRSQNKHSFLHHPDENLSEGFLRNCCVCNKNAQFKWNVFINCCQNSFLG